MGGDSARGISVRGDRCRNICLSRTEGAADAGEFAPTSFHGCDSARGISVRGDRCRNICLSRTEGTADAEASAPTSFHGCDSARGMTLGEISVIDGQIAGERYFRW